MVAYILLILFVVGLMQDRSYKRQGGKQPTGRARLLFFAIYGAGLVVAGWAGGAPALGQVLAGWGLVVFALWELWRWRVRRRDGW